MIIFSLGIVFFISTDNSFTSSPRIKKFTLYVNSSIIEKIAVAKIMKPDKAVK